MPDSFPGVLVLQEDQENTTQDLLHEDHGRFHLLDARRRGEEDRFKSDLPECKCFITHLLSRVRPKKTKFKKSKENKCVTDCFTASDEAFALIVLDNELGVWDAQLEKKGKGTSKKQKGSALRAEKKCTNGNSGRKKGSMCGWDKIGVMTHNRLVKEMKKVRQQRWEDEMRCRDMFMARANPEMKKLLEKGRQEHKDEDSESEVEFEGEDMLEEFDLQSNMISGEIQNLQL